MSNNAKVQFQQDEVSQAIWPWCKDPGNNPGHEQGTTLRRAVFQALVGGIAGALVFFFTARRAIAFVVWAIALFLLTTGIVLPRFYRLIDKGMQRFGHAVGVALTYLLLVPFYYLIFVPGHGLMRLLGRDPLKMRFPDKNPTAWSPRPPMKPNHFKRQF